MIKEILKISFNLMIVCVISALLLSVVNIQTGPQIEKRKKEIIQQTCKNLLPGASNFVEIEGSGIYKGINKDKVIGYVYESSSKGYGGTLEVMVGVSNDMTIKGVKIISHKETPGLGAKAKEPKFINQFNGKTIDKLEVTKSFDNNKIVAITGATITSRAVTKAVKDGMNKLQKYLGEKSK